MNIMAAAIQEALARGEESELLAAAVARAKEEDRQERARQIQQNRRQAAEEDKRRQNRIRNGIARDYHRRIQAAGRRGLGPLKPHTFPAWKPGRAALADGKPCRIKWGLSDGKKLHFIIVNFEYPQPLVGLEPKTTTYGFFPLAALAPCDCRGYIHKYGCTPKRKGGKKHYSKSRKDK